MIDCNKCPEKGCCCGLFPIPIRLLRANKTDFQVEPTKMVEIKEKFVALTEDLLCVFLNRKTKLCSIYDQRPEVCRLFGISEHADLQCLYFKRSGNRRSKASQTKTQRHINKMTDNLLNKYGNP